MEILGDERLLPVLGQFVSLSWRFCFLIQAVCIFQVLVLQGQVRLMGGVYDHWEGFLHFLVFWFVDALHSQRSQSRFRRR